MIKKVLLATAIVLLPFVHGHALDYNVPRLSPLPTNITEQRVMLNGEWAFNPSPGEGFNGTQNTNGWKRFQVPGEWVMQGFEVQKGEFAGYVRQFDIPDSWKGMRVKLRCNAIYSDSKVFINGKEAGSHLGGFTAFELDITDLAVTGTNTIAVSVASESLADATSNGSFYAVHPLGGITRDIYVYPLAETNFSMLHVSTSFDKNYDNATVKIDAELANESQYDAKNLSLDFVLKDADGNLVSTSSCTVPTMQGNSTQTVSPAFQVTRPHKWDNEHPYLYTLTCLLKQGKTVMASTTRRVGFRQIEVRGNQVFVNNSPIKLHGVCRHEVMPLRGRSLTDDIWRKDVELFRQGNVNYIRTSHYPPNEALLEACDELGMFVEVEAPFCWAHQTNVPEDMHTRILVNQHMEMVNLYRSHPSVLMWSLGNESLKFKEYFSEAAQVVKDMDPTRPRIFSQWSPDADEGTLEITNHHYPGPGGPDMYRNYGRPVTFDEFCHVNAYNRLELAADPGLRNMWGPLLDAMWNNMYHSQGVLGGAIWVGIDDTFFLPGDKAVGYGTWGTIDGWRREKPEYWGMKKAYSPVKLTLKGNMDSNGNIRLNVENRHLFSNISECELTWKAGGQQGTITADIAPRSEGDVEITLPEDARNADKLDIVVTGVRGYEIDRYSFRIIPESSTISPHKKTAGKITTQETANEIRINTGNGQFVVDKNTGLLSASCGGEAILTQSPTLMVLPLNGNGEGIQMVGKDQNFAPYNPLCTDWVAQSIEYIPGKKMSEVNVRGAYKEAEGTLSYHFYPDGDVEVSYHFVLSQDVSPRQTGLAFTTSDSMSTLEWKRQGYWNAYPENHIAALEGKANAYDKSLPISGLAGPSHEPSNHWSFDQTANGSNIFRSTKENIYSASLCDGTGHNISVISDGTQAFRAWKDGEVVRFLVADYNNAGSETYLVSHAQLGYRPLRKGDVVEGTVKLNVFLKPNK